MSMAIGSGISSQIMAVQETVPGGPGTYGVIPTDWSQAAAYEFKSETFALKKTTVQGQGLHAGGLYDRAKRRVLSTYAASGELTMDLPCNGLGLLLQNALGSFGQAAAAPTLVSGSTVGYQQVHNPGTLLGSSLCIQKGVPATDGTVQAFTYSGGKITSWTITCEVNQIAEFQAEFDFRNEVAGSGNGDPLNTSVPALQVPDYPVGMQLFHFREATLYTGGTASLDSSTGITTMTGQTAAAQVSKASVKHANSLDTTRFFLGSNGFKDEQIEDGFRKITGSFTSEWQSTELMYDAFSADTTTSLLLSFVGPIIDSGASYGLEVLVPNIKLDGESPAVSGPKVVTQDVTFTGLDDEATTPIQVTYTSTDSALTGYVAPPGSGS